MHRAESVNTVAEKLSIQARFIGHDTCRAVVLTSPWRLLQWLTVAPGRVKQVMISSSAWKTPSPMKIRSVLGYHYFSLWPSPSNRRTPPIDFPYPPSFKKNRLQRGPIECFGTPFRPPSICLYVRFYCRKN